MNCPHCSAPTPNDAAFCPKCGGAVSDPAQNRRVETASPPAGPTLGSRHGHPADDKEVELWRGGYSGKAMINYWVVAALASISLPAVAAVLRLDANGWFVLFALLAVMWLGLLVILAFHKLDVHYVLTNQRLIHKTGILSRRTDRVEVIDFDDVSFRQGVVERMLGVGTIEIESSDRSDPTLSLPGINDVQAVANLMDDARRRERIRRGLHIEAV